MGLQLPDEVSWLLNEVGYTWPNTDEVKLFELGRHWLDFGGQVGEITDEASTAAQGVWANNHGEAITALKARWDADKSPLAVAKDGQGGAQAIGAALFVCAGIVLALKINVIVQLTILLVEITQAIAEAPVTFGASLLEIPAFKKLTGMAINVIVDEAVEAILG